jgi:sulfur-carrier protein
MIDILFFGRMADIMGHRRLRQSLASDCNSLWKLRDTLFKEAFALARVQTDAIHMSVNQVTTRSDLVLSEGDEIAFFSVFSGG